MTSTALGYQMMIEQHLLEAMRNAESRNNYYIACAYAKAYGKFLGVDKDTLPKTPMPTDSIMTNSNQLQTHYFDLLMVIVDKMKTTLDEVRAKYGKGKNTPMVIPKS